MLVKFTGGLLIAMGVAGTLQTFEGPCVMTICYRYDVPGFIDQPFLWVDCSGAPCSTPCETQQLVIGPAIIIQCKCYVVDLSPCFPSQTWLPGSPATPPDLDAMDCTNNSCEPFCRSDADVPEDVPDCSFGEAVWCACDW